MNKDIKSGGNYATYIKAFILGILVSAVAIVLFSVLMFFTGKGFEYSAVFGTVCVATGTFAAAFYAAKKIARKGFVVGLTIGTITFLAVTLVSLIVDSGSMTLNTLFHFIIIMLSALIGGILGVNKASSKKYI